MKGKRLEGGTTKFPLPFSSKQVSFFFTANHLGTYLAIFFVSTFTDDNKTSGQEDCRIFFFV